MRSALVALSPGAKRLEGKADHSLPSCAKVTNEWSYTSTLPRLHGVQRNNLFPKLL